MTNNPKFTVSVQENSNKIIGSSEEKFTGIRPGNLIRMENDDLLYTILKNENTFYIRNFIVQDSKTIIIEENTGINLQTGDNIQITFKEYEALMILDILDGGHSYKDEDEITVLGGDLNIDISNGIGNPTILNITEIDGNGTIKSAGIKDKGKYLSYPQNPVEVHSNDGINAKFELKYEEKAEREILEREIIGIHFKDNMTLITLNYSLPLKLTKGKISVEKNSLILTSNYLGKTTRNLKYQIFRDFTPYLKLGLLVKNSLSLETLVNKNFFTLDDKISELNNKINMLEKKINNLKN